MLIGAPFSQVSGTRMKVRNTEGVARPQSFEMLPHQKPGGDVGPEDDLN